MSQLPESAQGATWWRTLRGFQCRNLWFAAFVAPFVLGLLVFVYIPIAWSAYLSLFDARNTINPTRFVGLQNYRYLLTDPLFRNSLLVFIAFAGFIVPLTYVCSLGLALLLNGLTWGQAFFRSAFFIPTACSYVIAAMIWRLSFFNDARFSLANQLVRGAGGDNVNWLGGTNYWYWLVLVSLRLWLVTREDTRTVQVTLSRFMTSQGVRYPELFAGALVATMPVVVVFLFLQRYLVKGVESSGID